MSERSALIDLLAAHLLSACPTRVHSRSLRDAATIPDADLSAGVITLLANGEGNYPNLRDGIGKDGRMHLMAIGQLRVAENTETQAIEAAELTLFEELLAALRSGTGLLKCIDLTAMRQSAQLEHPYGWISLELDWTP